MPYASPLTHIRAEGVFGSSAAAPVEIWSFGFHLGIGMLPAGHEENLPDVWTAFAAYIGAADGPAAFGTNCFLTEVMAADIAPSGALSAGYYTRYAGPAPVAGQGVQAGGLPLQITYAVTLDAGKPAAGRFGRFYPPPQAETPFGRLSNGQASEAAAAARAAAAATLLNAVEDVYGARVVAASKVAGTNRPVTAIRSGRVPDTQRRRRNGLPEGYSSTPLS